MIKNSEKIRHRRTTQTITLACLLTLVGATASAQNSVQLDNFRSAETAEDGFAVSRPNDRGDMHFGAQLYIDYGMNPLVFEEVRGDARTERTAIVANHLVGNLGLSFGLFNRLVLFAGLPVNIVMDGTARAGYPAADGAGLSDAWMGGRLRLFGESQDVFALALQFTANAPSADYSMPAQRYSGDIGWTFMPELLLELRFGAGIRLTANAGAKLRALDAGRIRPLFEGAGPALSVGHEFVWSAGLTVPLVREMEREIFDVYLEGYGRNTFENFGNRELSTIELILGLKVQPANGLYLGVAGGTGISRGYGAPDLRLIGTIGWADPVAPAGEVVVEEVHAADSDGDGVMDADDACPSEPEDMDGFEDSNGCPDPDNDGDGILDGSDAAPNEAEDMDGFQDTDGAPEADNDGDGIPDATDAAPNDAEDMDGFQDSDGAPDPDNDQDGILDGSDRCPLDPGQPSTNPEENGCPRTVRVDRETGRIMILQKVEFANGRDVILERSYPVLEEVRAVLAANPQILTIRVEGHTDDRGNDARNLELSRRRARAVRAWLASHGLDANRMVGFGCGEVSPSDTNATNDGRQANRRVEFHIVNPAPAAGIRELAGCVSAE